MNAEQTFSLAAGAAFLGLAGVAALRGRASSGLSRVTALLCVALFAYNTLELLGSLTNEPHWPWLESAAAALSAPLLFHLVLAFLGARRARRGVLLATYGYFGLVAASCLTPLFAPSMASYPGGGAWAIAMLLGLAPTFGVAILALFRHYAASGSPEERARTQLFGVTLAIGVGGPAADLGLIAADGSGPPLAAASMLLSAFLLTALAVRAKALRGALSLLVVNAVVIGAAGAITQVLVFQWFGGRTSLLVLGSLVVTLALLAAARSTWANFAEYRERAAHLATLGRLSAQMAHDIRNPLAAIHGAAQYLDEERRRGASLEDQAEFIALILGQTERLERVVADYDRLGRAEPALEDVDVAALMERVAEGARLSAPNGVTIRVEREPARGDGDGGARRAPLDPELVATALENLVRNACEAMDGEGTVTLRCARTSAAGRELLALSVIDDGPGMDPRVRERAEDAFFTTKAQGSGLGLAFARRVAEAHGGELRIESALGHGTTVRLELRPERPSVPPRRAERGD